MLLSCSSGGFGQPASSAALGSDAKVRLIATAAALRATAPAPELTRVATSGFAAEADGGAANYMAAPDAPRGTYRDNGCTVIVPQGGDGSAAWLAELGDTPHALQCGLVGDGVTDDSAAMQAFIDANKGKSLVFDANKSFLVQGVTLVGASYDNTRLDFQGELKLKPAPTAGSANFQSACWTALAFQQVEGITLQGHFNGDRNAQQMREQTFIAVMAGVTKFTAPFLSIREIRGDGLYIAQALLKSKSTTTNGVAIGTIEGFNSADDGRNLVTIISGSNINIGTLTSNHIGGTILGAIEPGGLDIEPDAAYEVTDGVSIGKLTVVSSGTSGLAIFGSPGISPKNVRNVTVGVSDVTNTAVPTTVDAAGNLTVTSSHNLLVKHAANVTISAHAGTYTKAFGDGVDIIDSDNVSIYATETHNRVCAKVNVPTDSKVKDASSGIHMTINCDGPTLYGLQTGTVSDAIFRGNITNPVAGYYTAALFAVYTSSFPTGDATTQKNVIYSVDIPFHPNWVRGFRNEPAAPVTYSGDTAIADMSFLHPSGAWASSAKMIDARIPTRNVAGYK